MAYICLGCNEVFRAPMRYVEMHNLDTPPYEEYYACPFCGDAYAEAYECEECGKHITGTYIKTKCGVRICENCYTVYELGDEY